MFFSALGCAIDGVFFVIFLPNKNILNFQAYDVHMLIESLAKHEDELERVQIVPQTMEKYTSIITPKFRLVYHFIYQVI